MSEDDTEEMINQEKTMASTQKAATAVKPPSNAVFYVVFLIFEVIVIVDVVIFVSMVIVVSCVSLFLIC